MFYCQSDTLPLRVELGIPEPSSKHLKRAGAMVDMERLERQHTWNLSSNSTCAGFPGKALTKCMFNSIEPYIVMNVAAYRHRITNTRLLRFGPNQETGSSGLSIRLANRSNL